MDEDVEVVLLLFGLIVEVEELLEVVKGVEDVKIGVVANSQLKHIKKHASWNSLQ